MTRAAHLTDAQLADLESADASGAGGVPAHLHTCRECAQRYEDVRRLRRLLATTGRREQRPLRDVVPSAMMRVRLRRHSVTNANELLAGLAALARGVASLFSLPVADPGQAGAGRRGHDDRRE